MDDYDFIDAFYSYFSFNKPEYNDITKLLQSSQYSEVAHQAMEYSFSKLPKLLEKGTFTVQDRIATFNLLHTLVLSYWLQTKAVENSTTDSKLQLCLLCIDQAISKLDDNIYIGLLHELKGDIYNLSLQFEGAISSYKTAREKYDTNPEAWFNYSNDPEFDPIFLQLPTIWQKGTVKVTNLLIYFGLTDKHRFLENFGDRIGFKLQTVQKEN